MSFFPLKNIFCLCFHVFILLRPCLAADRIGLNQNITDGQKLVSTGQKFELGFFSPGRPKNKYLGIWYKTIPDVVMWVANREIPLTDSKGIFKISSNGTPVVVNGTDSIIWSSNVSRAASAPMVQLLDDGNLVLIDKASTNSSHYLWQSFDHPGNTRLPGMLMGENPETGQEQYLTSWRSSDDPSSGGFIYRVDNNPLPHLVLTLGTVKKYRTEPWNGIQLSGLSVFPNAVDDSVMVFRGQNLTSISDPYNYNSLTTRLTLNHSGTIQRYVLDGTKNEWNLLYTIPNNLCDNYGECGPNSVCNTNTSPICRCLKGFTEKDQRKWRLLGQRDGCVRVETPKCPGDGFVNISGVKLPDMLQTQLMMNVSLSECESECLRIVPAQLTPIRTSQQASTAV